MYKSKKKCIHYKVRKKKPKWIGFDLYGAIKQFIVQNGVASWLLLTDFLPRPHRNIRSMLSLTVNLLWKGMRSSRLLLPWKIATGCEPSSAKGSMWDRCRMIRKLSLAAERKIEVVVAYLLYGIILARRNMIDRIWIVPGFLLVETEGSESC